MYVCMYTISYSLSLKLIGISPCQHFSQWDSTLRLSTAWLSHSRHMRLSTSIAIVSVHLRYQYPCTLVLGRTSCLCIFLQAHIGLNAVIGYRNYLSLRYNHHTGYTYKTIRIGPSGVRTYDLLIVEQTPLWHRVILLSWFLFSTICWNEICCKRGLKNKIFKNETCIVIVQNIFILFFLSNFLIFTSDFAGIEKCQLFIYFCK